MQYRVFQLAFKGQSTNEMILAEAFYYLFRFVFHKRFRSEDKQLEYILNDG